MTVGACDIEVGDGEHSVHFYETERGLTEVVGEYLIEAAQAGAITIVIATEAHQRAFEAELDAGGIDPAQSRRDRMLVALDAAATLRAFMPGGRLDRDAFGEVIGTVVRDAVRKGRPVRAYGEMVALLWERGDVLAAIELEKLWNELRRELKFTLLCAYRSESVAGSDHAQALHEVCHQHSSVSRAPAEAHGQFAPDRIAPASARWMVADALARWGHNSTTVDDARLIVSELATNAVVHARTVFSVTVRSTGSRVHLAVRDACPAPPVVRAGGPMAARGRGLPLVGTLARDWGVELTAGGKAVWVQLHP